MYIVVFVTAANKEEADKIAQALIKNKLAACVNIVDGIHSVFRWQGKIEKSKEALLIIKSKRANFGRIIKAVKKLHSYDVPEIISLPIIAGNKDYLDWINQSLV